VSTGRTQIDAPAPSRLSVAHVTKPLLFALLCAIWGSTWLVIKVGYGGLGPFNVAGLRFLLAGLVMVPVALAMRAPWPRGARAWGVVAVVGAVLFAADYGLIYWGEQRLTSGLTAVLFAVMPLLTALGAHLYLPAERLTPRKLGGALLAFAGVAALFGDSLRFDPTLLPSMAAIVASAACAAAASLATKKHGGALHPAALNAPAMLVGAGLLAAASFAAGEGFALPSDAPTWGAVAYLALAGSVVTFLADFHLLRTWEATTMSYIAIFTPVIALALGFIVLGERPTAWTALGTLLILGGVALALVRRGAPKAAPREDAPPRA
jgi:drug/metabolite transporter (DMT)-like permease